MPHQCVRCNNLYPDGAKEILKGCSCGARLFFYIKKKNIEEGKQLINNFHQVASESGINKTYSMVDRNNQFKLAMAHLFHNSGYRGIDSNWDLERYTDPFTLYIRGLNHQRVSVQHEE